MTARPGAPGHPQRGGPRLRQGAGPPRRGPRRARRRRRPQGHGPRGYGLQQNGGSAFAWQGLGNEAGRPGAGSGVHVALIDTGVSDNAYLNRASGHLVDAIDTSGLVDDDGTGDPTTEIQTTGTFTDGYGHGTFMASLIAGGGSVKGGRTLGVAPGATVDVVKVADADGQSRRSAR